MTLTDDSPMPSGAHAGTPMKDVPAKYLDWLLGQKWFQGSSQWAPVREYIETHIDAIQAEIED